MEPAMTYREQLEAGQAWMDERYARRDDPAARFKWKHGWVLLSGGPGGGGHGKPAASSDNPELLSDDDIRATIAELEKANRGDRAHPNRLLVDEGVPKAIADREARIQKLQKILTDRKPGSGKSYVGAALAHPHHVVPRTVKGGSPSAYPTHAGPSKHDYNAMPKSMRTETAGGLDITDLLASLDAMRDREDLARLSRGVSSG